MSNPSNSFDLGDVGIAIGGSTFHEALRGHYWPKNDSFVLEDASGTGKLGMYLALQGCNVVLLDVDQAQLMRSGKILSMVETILEVKLPVIFRHGDALALPYSDDTFHLVFGEGIIEHWPPEKQFKYLSEMKRVSRDVVALSCPDAEDEESMRRSRETVFHYQTMPEKEHPLTQGELRKKMEDVGLKKIQTKKFMMTSEVGHVFGIGWK